MTAVRIFHHGPMIALPISAASARYAHGDVVVLPQPYLGRQTLEALRNIVIRSDPAPTGTAVVVIEVPHGKEIAYEISPQGQKRDADQNSPRLTGTARFNFGPGWVVNVLDTTPEGATG